MFLKTFYFEISLIIKTTKAKPSVHTGIEDGGELCRIKSGGQINGFYAVLIKKNSPIIFVSLNRILRLRDEVLTSSGFLLTSSLTNQFSQPCAIKTKHSNERDTRVTQVLKLSPINCFKKNVCIHQIALLFPLIHCQC